MPLRDKAQKIIPGRLPENVYSKNGSSAGSNCRLDQAGVDIVCFRINVHEYRTRPLEEQTIAGRNKAEWSSNYFVAVFQVQCPNDEVKARSSAVHSDREAALGVVGNLPLEF